MRYRTERNLWTIAHFFCLGGIYERVTWKNSLKNQKDPGWYPSLWGFVPYRKVKKNKKSTKKGKVKGQDEKRKAKKDAALNISGKEVNSRVNSNIDNSNNTDGSQAENSNVKGTTV